MVLLNSAEFETAFPFASTFAPLTGDISRQRNNLSYPPPWLSTVLPDSDLRVVMMTSAVNTSLQIEERADGTDEKPWNTFKQPLYAVVILAIVYVLVAIVGVISNTMVVTVIYRQPMMRSVTNCFLSNLAIADILVCVSVLPITLLENIFTEWWYGPALCKAFPYLQGVSVSASVNTLAAVAVERFLATFYPQTSKMTWRSAAVVIAFLWTIPAILFIPWILVFNETVYKVKGFEFKTCHQNWVNSNHRLLFTVGVVFFTCYLLPLIFIGIFYLMIGIRVWQRKVRGIAGSRADKSIHRSKSRILLMLAVVFAVFVVSWLPLYCMNIFMLIRGSTLNLSQKNLLRFYLLPIAQWMGAANSCVNPFIYCCFSQNFRRSFVSVIGSMKRRRSISTAKSIKAADLRTSNNGPPR